MKNAEYWIKKLGLERHPEGGWYSRVYESALHAKKEHLPPEFKGDRHFATSIYFLLEAGDFSALHRIKSDEIWHFYAGSDMTIHMIDSTGTYSEKTIGAICEDFQFAVPAGYWFGATVDEPHSFSLVGCTVSPGFHFDDFELAKRGELTKQYPYLKGIIAKLTRE